MVPARPVSDGSPRTPLHLAEQLAARGGGGLAAGALAHGHVEQHVARAAHVRRAHARADGAGGVAALGAGAQVDALAREPRGAGVGDVVPGRLHHLLLRGERRPGGVEDGA
jgi:hypothetical protein